MQAGAPLPVPGAGEHRFGAPGGARPRVGAYLLPMLIRSKKFQQMAEKLQRVAASVEREGGETVELRGRLEEALQAVGVDVDAARLLDAETLARALASDAGKLWSVAEALYLEGLLARAEGDEERAEARLGKAGVLFSHLEAGLDLPEAAASPEDRLREIERRLGSV